jgi:hypothetical protein
MIVKEKLVISEHSSIEPGLHNMDREIGIMTCSCRVAIREARHTGLASVITGAFWDRLKIMTVAPSYISPRHQTFDPLSARRIAEYP